MVALDPTAEVVLPFGLTDGRGRRARRASLIPINGRGEMLGAEATNPFRAALHLLASSITRLGSFHESEIDAALLGTLLPIDRDFLLLQVNRLTFGDNRFQTVACPAPECGRRVDVQFDLSSLTPPPLPAGSVGRLLLPDTREVHYRLPAAADQVELYGLPTEELEAAFLSRCVRSHPDGISLDIDAVLALSPELRAGIVREIAMASPEFDTTLDLECVECGKTFLFAYDPVRSLLGDLRASRSVLLREVHQLAFHYHWSQTEILRLSRSARHEYLDLLEEEFNRPTWGAR